jgi:hypothetical protein
MLKWKNVVVFPESDPVLVSMRYMVHYCESIYCRLWIVVKQNIIVHHINVHIESLRTRINILSEVDPSTFITNKQNALYSFNFTETLSL